MNLEIAEWRPIAEIPQTLEKFLVACVHGESHEYQLGVNAFNATNIIGFPYYSHYLANVPKAPEKPHKKLSLAGYGKDST